MKKCNKCNRHLPITNFHKDNFKKDGLRTICKECTIDTVKKYREANRGKHNLSSKNYRDTHKDKVRESNRSYIKRNIIKVKDSQRRRIEKHRKEYDDYHKQYRKRNAEQLAIKARENRQTEKGKEISIKHHTKRKRNLGWSKLWNNPFPDEVKIEWHHINNLLVIPIPKRLHQLIRGKTHRHRCNDLIDKLYNIDLEAILI